MDEVELTAELIRINSENPPGQEKELAFFVRDYIQDNIESLEADVVRVDDKRYNTVCYTDGEPDGLMLNGHLDTVPTGNSDLWTHDPFSAEIVNERLYGRGACDMKGAIACMITAARNVLRQKGKPLEKKLLLAFTADEETDCLGAREILDKKEHEHILENIRYGIIGEPTMLNVVRMHKGVFFLRVEIKGKAAHGCVPEKGTNAIVGAARLVNYLKTSYENPKKTHPVGVPTLNIGKISGGTKVNMVPDRCVLELGRRTIPTETEDEVLAGFQKAVDKLGLQANLQVVTYKEPFDVAADSRIVRTMEEITETKATGVFYWTEASLYSRYGLECAVCGPGSIEQAHKPNEFVEVGQLRRATKVYEEAISRLC